MDAHQLPDLSKMTDEEQGFVYAMLILYRGLVAHNRNTVTSVCSILDGDDDDPTQFGILITKEPAMIETITGSMDEVRRVAAEMKLEHVGDVDVPGQPKDVEKN